MGEVPFGVQPRREDGRLQCLECGRWYRSLAAHLFQSEDTSVDDYRERHGLPATMPLVSIDMSDRLRELARKRRQRGELLPIQDLRDADEIAASGRAGNTRHRETASRPGVRAAHQAGVVKGRTQAHNNARAVLHHTATALGYTDWEDLIRQTRHQSIAAVARVVSRNPRTIAYWRRQILGENWKTEGGRLQPRRAAAYARLDEVFAARGWADLPAALAWAGKHGMRGVAREVGSTQRVLRGWEEHRRPRPAETPA
ncbi:MucR family transcriptional regulator [Streptosporangium sp. NPDC048865]|uniref:MucR family transcriptional regulator n=1 Tax=Streptosporangium sp. NPDC048865 TaxID=3155766 RepID=UPI00344AA060